MQESDQQNLYKVSKRNGHHPLLDERLLSESQEGMDEQEEVSSLQQRESLVPVLPQDRLRSALMIGVITGIFCSLQSIVITLVNSPLYQTYAMTPDSQRATKQALSITVLEIGSMTFFINLLLWLIAGFVTGKVVVKRKLGFLAGGLAGVITYLASFITHYVPSYPGNVASHTSGNAMSLVGAIIVSLIFVLVWAGLGGLISLLGAWLATRRHPYYAVEPIQP